MLSNEGGSLGGRRSSRPSQNGFWSPGRQLLLLLSLGFLSSAQHMWAQAPGLLWTTNVGARLFAVDEQTNVYANAGGTVIKLNASGVPLQTNAICPNATWAQRDSTGNLYFAGVLPGTFVGSGY